MKSLPRPSTSPMDPRFFVAFFLIVVMGGIVDLVLDAPTSWSSPHILVEVFLVTFSLSAAAYIYLGWRRANEAFERARIALEARRDELEEWRARARKLLRGLGAEIDRQLREWCLTPAERQVALLLLKGFSHREIARLQGISERTIRQHSVAVYRKSGLAGRAELSAYFLEDLLLPVEETLTGREGSTHQSTVPSLP